MSINEIINSLETQIHNLRNFLVIIKSKQDSLIKRDIEALSLSMESEEKFIAKIDKEEQNRLMLMDNLISEIEYNDDKKELRKLPNFINAISGITEEGEIELLKEKQEVVKDLTQKVIKVNGENRHLIENAKSLLKEIITAAVGERKQSIIDRRI
ncbi:MAG: hypothetical protein HND52_04245 [Ignavibacteriae bacterium]|jgi:hypothetical protein|nr:hypothetical protein [Ignavibacteriota bacterium]NOG97168.1 hypothetical protein [Ignavibacteriota bacterium]